MVDLGCDISVRRNYQILLDPVARLSQTSNAAYPSETDAIPFFESDKQQLAKPARSDYHPTQSTVKRRKQISEAELNLAIAYQDIGDTEGANLLLEEITKEDTPEQIEQAIALLTMRH